MSFEFVKSRRTAVRKKNIFSLNDNLFVKNRGRVLFLPFENIKLFCYKLSLLQTIGLKVLKG